MPASRDPDGRRIATGGSRVAATSDAFDSARLDDIDRDPGRPEWIPIRRRFGITAFGVNAWSAAGPDDALIPEHEESSIGHHPPFADAAREDDDFASLRDEPPFARIVGVST